jgi:hypothetical protein
MYGIMLYTSYAYHMQPLNQVQQTLSGGNGTAKTPNYSKWAPFVSIALSYLLFSSHLRPLWGQATSEPGPGTPRHAYYFSDMPNYCLFPLQPDLCAGFEGVAAVS